MEIPQKITNDKPLSEIPEEEVKKEETLEPFTVKDYKVLVVDDNQINRKVARSFLQSYELEITEAESGMEAIRLVRDTQFDIIFMDHMMPEMDGIETVQNIRNDYGEDRKLPIIIALTANAMDGVRENFLSNGFQDFITKPLDRKALHMVLLKWIPKENRMTGKSWLKHLQSDSDKFLEFQKILIEGIDTDEVVEHYSGSAEEYKELLNLYCLDGKRKLNVLKELLEEQDYKGYGIEVHGLKSASANVGAMRISNRAREQEKAINREDFTFVDSHAGKLLAEYEEQLEYIRNYLEKDRKAEKNREAKEQKMEKPALLQEIETALNHLENFQSKECSNMIEHILEYQLDADTETQLEKVMELLKLYEDDKAEQVLQKLIEEIQKED